MTPIVAPPSDIAAIAFGFAAGVSLGLFHFATLRRIATLYLSDAAPHRAFALQFVRFVLLAAVLALLARLGAAVLLAATPGLLIGRYFVLRQGREAR